MTNRNEFSSNIIRRTGQQDGRVNFHGLHIFQLWDLTGGVDFHRLHLVGYSDTLSAAPLDRASWFGRLHVVGDVRCTHPWIGANGLYVNVDFPSLDTCFAILDNQLLIVLDVHAGAEHNSKRMVRDFRTRDFVLVSHVGVRKNHCQMLDYDKVESILTHQFVSTILVDSFAGLIEELQYT